MVHPFLWICNPASLDVRLGFSLMIEVADTPELQRINISDRTENRPYLLRLVNFALLKQLKLLTCDTISSQFVLKSSRAHSGLNHLLARWLIRVGMVQSLRLS